MGLIRGLWREVVLLVFGCLMAGGCADSPGVATAPRSSVPERGSENRTPGTISRSGDMLAADFAPEYRSGVTLVFFSKIGCKACVQMEPVFAEVVREIPSGARSIQVLPYMIDLNFYRIEEFPTLVIYRDGLEQKRYVGVTSGKKLLSAVKSAL